MTKVVFQNRSYWLRDDFWQEVHDADLNAVVVGFWDGVWTVRPIDRAEFEQGFGERVANWAFSVAKSVSVFRESLNASNRAIATQLFQEAVVTGLQIVAPQFTARTGAQGKVRLPAEASFVVVVHTSAKDGSPQLHAHIAVCDRVRAPSRDTTFATNKRELYSLRNLFAAATSQHLAHSLIRQFGVRVEKTERGFVLPDVPQSLCHRSSIRSQQIDAFIQSHQLKNSPLARKLAALFTRRENPDPRIGQSAFEAARNLIGFRSEQICRRVSLGNWPERNHVRRVQKLAQRLTQNQPLVTRNELLIRALEVARPDESVRKVVRGVDRVMASANQRGLQLQTNEFGKPVLAHRNALHAWRRIARRVEHIIEDDAASPTNARRTRRSNPGAKVERPSPSSSGAAFNDTLQFVQSVLRSYRVIGAVGRHGIQAAQAAVELYQSLAQPIWQVKGRSSGKSPGSVARMVRDLKPLSRLESHREAILGMLKRNGTVQEKLRYGEAIYKRSRTPKFHIPKKCLIVVRDSSLSSLRDLGFLLGKARQAKAKVLLVDREFSRSQLLQAARRMQPGEIRRVRGPEMTR